MTYIIRQNLSGKKQFVIYFSPGICFDQNIFFMCTRVPGCSKQGSDSPLLSGRNGFLRIICDGAATIGPYIINKQQFIACILKWILQPYRIAFFNRTKI